MVDATGTTTYSYDNDDRLTSYQNGAGATVSYSYDPAGNVTAIVYPNGKTVTQSYNTMSELASVTDWNNQTTSFALRPRRQPNRHHLPQRDRRHPHLQHRRPAHQHRRHPSSHQPAQLRLHPRPRRAHQRRDRHRHPQPRHHQLHLQQAQPAHRRQHQHLQLRPRQQPHHRPRRHQPNLQRRRRTLLDRYRQRHLHHPTQPGPPPTPTTTKATAPEPPPQPAVPPATAGTNPASSPPSPHPPAAPPATPTTPTASSKPKPPAAPPPATPGTPKPTYPNSSADATNYYIYGNGPGPIEQINTTTGTTSYLLTDQLGSTRALTNSAGTPTANYTYDPWGNTTATTGTPTTPFLYAGQYKDPATGLYYLRARWYDPATGQFLSLDPQVATTNAPYNYASDDPIDQTDPSGLNGEESRTTNKYYAILEVKGRGNWVSQVFMLYENYQTAPVDVWMRLYVKPPGRRPLIPIIEEYAFLGRAERGWVFGQYVTIGEAAFWNYKLDSVTAEVSELAEYSNSTQSVTGICDSYCPKQI